MLKMDNISFLERKIDRRSFLKISGILGMGIASAGIIPGKAGAVDTNRKLYKDSEAILAMGTTVSMTLVYHSRKKAEEAMALAFKEIDRLSGLMNRFDEKSPISRLNRDGRLENAPPDLIKVIEASLYYNNLTNGIFDITITPVLDLFGKKFSKGSEKGPSEKEIKKVLELVGSDLIEIGGSNISFRKKGMSITLDGIAKGYAVDMASKILLKHDIKNHLINAGGDIFVMGLRIDGKPWRVGVLNPEKGKEPEIIIDLTGAAIATSGNYENFFDREKMFHHIVNPKTGLSPIVNVSASVIAPTAMEADALATSMMIMSPGEGLKFIDSLPECESLIIERNGRIVKSSGWKNFAI